MQKANILIVEDERIVAMDIHDSLVALGYTIAGQADQGEDAVRKAGVLHPDLILMDIVLKGKMDGILAAEQIQKEFNIPVIFLTAFSDEVTLDRARLTEPYGYIVKPIEKRELVSNIEIAMYKHQAEQARNMHLKQTELINKIGRALAELQDVQQVLEVIYQQVKLNLPLNMFFVSLYDPTQKILSFPLVYDQDHSYQEPPRPLAYQTNTRMVVETAKPLLINRTMTEIKSQALGQYSVGDKTQPSASLLFAPLLDGDQVIGVISAQSYTLNAYTEHHLNLLAGVACFAAVAIKNARLFANAQNELTERRQMEAALRESENKYRSVIENASDGIVLSDQNGLVIEWNQALEDLTGLKRAETIGQPVWDIVSRTLPRDKYTNNQGAIAVANAQNQVNNNYQTLQAIQEYEIEDKKGQRRYIQSTGFTIPSSGGMFGGAILRDVTQKRIAELEILVSKNQLNATLKAIPDLLVELDLHGRHFSYHAPQNGILSTTVPEDNIGKTINEVLPPEAAEVVMAALLEANETNTSFGKQLSLHLPQGVFWFEISVSAMPTTGSEEPHFIVLARDITARKSAEVDRDKLIDKLKVKNNELEQFTYTVSHDLKAPLFSIRGFLGYLENDIASGNAERIKADLARIKASSEKMQLLLNDLLELSRTGRITNSA